MSIDVRPLTPQQRDALPGVRDLAARAERHDGVAPFNEASLLALDSLAHPSPDGERRYGWLALDGDEVVAAALDAESDGSAIDMVVAPDRRRQGLARALVDAVLSEFPKAAFWAHGSLDSAARFAAASNLQAARELWVMSRDVTPGENFDVELPEGLIALPYDGSDAQAEAWLAVNALAFAHHPEQGRMTIEDFRRRRSEPWFDPDGLILVWDTSVEPAVLAASHWTKQEPGERVGEVYVVAVAPAYQGRGIARPLTNLGLQYLARQGVTRIELYVEGDNEPAKAAYARAEFVRSTGDTMYQSSTVCSEGSTQE